MKIVIVRDEWWPVYVPEEDIEDHWDKPVEVPDEIVKKWHKTEKAFSKAMAELAKYY